MSNNPFDSFHDMVAEAKAEREQLDRLLTISTPRERLLVVVIGLLLAVLVGWLFLGSVPRDLALHGALVEPRDFQPDGSPSVRALVWVEPAIAKRLRAGLPAQVVVPVAGGKRETLNGTLAAIAVSPYSEPGAEVALSLPLSALVVDLALDEGLDFASLTGRECRIVVELGRQPPAAMFAMGRS